MSVKNKLFRPLHHIGPSTNSPMTPIHFLAGNFLFPLLFLKFNKALMFFIIVCFLYDCFSNKELVYNIIILFGTKQKLPDGGWPALPASIHQAVSMY